MSRRGKRSGGAAAFSGDSDGIAARAPPSLVRESSASKSEAEVQELTNWVDVPRTAEELKGQSCCVCMMEYDEELRDGCTDPVVRLGKCAGHYLHSACAVASFQHSTKCPLCLRIYGIHFGDQPPGSMTVDFSPIQLSGFRCGTIQITYSFPSGTQSARHPNPGRPYSGTSRVGYLPDNEQGHTVLQLLTVCFQRRHTFTVGTSVTTGLSNCVIWNGIHHKTNTSGGPTSFGYPDPTYLSRVTEELAAKGVTYEDIFESGKAMKHPEAVVRDSTGYVAHLIG